MNIAEKLTQIAENEQKVYQAGYTDCLKDVVVASSLPFYLTPFEATAWYRATAERGDVSVDNGVLYRRFQGKQENTYGVSVTTIADKNNKTSKHIAGKYLVFKMRTTYSERNNLSFCVEIGIECSHIAELQNNNGLHRVNERDDNGHNAPTWHAPAKDGWGIYVIDLSTVCDEYAEDENGQYPPISTSGIAFYSWTDQDHTNDYVDFAYSAVCATPVQVAELIKKDTAFLWKQADKKWTKEFDPLTDLK